MNTILLSCALLCTAAPPPQTADTAETLLYVRTTPSGAEIRLGGQPLGTSDGLFPVEPGTYKIIIDLTDHRPKEQEITVRNGRITRLELELDKRPPAKHTGNPRTADEMAVREVIAKFVEAAGKGDGQSAVQFVAANSAVRHQIDDMRESQLAGVLAAEIRRFDESEQSKPTDATAGRGPAPPNRRPRYFVRLVLGKDDMTLEGEKTTWEELPKLLEKVPHRKQTVLEIAEAPDDATPQQRKADFRRACRLSWDFGFEYPSDTGTHPLGAKGSPAQIHPEPSTPENVAQMFLNALVQREIELMQSLIVETTKVNVSEMVRELRDEAFAADPTRLSVISQTLVEGDLAAVRVDGPEGEENHYLYLILRRIGPQWWICRVDDSKTDVPLKERLGQYAARQSDSSRVLGEAFAKMLGDLVVELKEDGRELPPGWDTPQLAFRTLETLKEQFPEVLTVTKQQEQRFADGQFDDGAASARARKAVSFLADLELDLPAFDALLVKRYEAEKLGGAELELAARILEARAEAVNATLGAEDATTEEAADSETSAEAILRRYSETVWANALPLVDSAAPAKTAKIVQQVAAAAALRHVMPHKNSVAQYVMSRLPDAEPLDLSQWAEVSTASDFPELPIEANTVWHPVVAAAGWQKWIMSRVVSARDFGKLSLLCSFAPRVTSVLDRSVENPVIANAYGDQLVIVSLRRADDGFYHCDKVQRLKKTPTTTQDYFVLPADASEAQRRERFGLWESSSELAIGRKCIVFKDLPKPRLVIGSQQNHVFCVVLRPKYARSFHPQIQDSTYRALDDAAADRQLLLASQAVVQASRGCIPQ